MTALTPLALSGSFGIYWQAMESGKPSVLNVVTDTAAAEQEARLCALVARIAAHDPSALEALYDSSAARLYGLARRITGDVGAAEEVVSDAYWQAWQQAGRYDATRGRVLAWLLTICRSRALDWRRRRDQAETHPDPPQLRPDLYEGDNNPLDLLQALQRDSRVHAALARLDDTPRRLLALAFFQGLTHQEIAAQVDMPLGTVKTLLRKAMLVLKEDLILASVSPEDCP